jgi:octaprenyl-diphosphate synthase
VKDAMEIPTELAPVADSLASGLARVASVFDGALASDYPPVSRLCAHVERYRGKMLRPSLVLLCGAAAHPLAGITPIEKLCTGVHDVLGAVVEMVHMATLVHDDVLDEADVRRRGATVNRLHGNEAAVMLGDFLIASSFKLCASLDDPRFTRAVGRASAVLCEGELLQLHHREDYSLDEPTYFEILDRKTASLIACACEVGAVASGASPTDVESCVRYGRSLGLAFQIQDDILDLTGREETVGKSVGKDIEKGKATLPLIHHLSRADEARRAKTLLALAEAPKDVGRAAEVVEALRATDSLSYSRGVARELVNAARQAIATLTPSPAASMLTAMADAVISRDH